MRYENFDNDERNFLNEIIKIDEMPIKDITREYVLYSLEISQAVSVEEFEPVFDELIEKVKAVEDWEDFVSRFPMQVSYCFLREGEEDKYFDDYSDEINSEE